MCYKTFDICPYTMTFVLQCVMTEKMCNKAVDSYFFYTILFLISIKLKKRVIELFLMILF